MGLSMQGKKALTREVSRRYQQAGKKDKTGIPNELARRFALYDPVKLQREVHKAVDALASQNKAINLEGAKALAASALQAV